MNKQIVKLIIFLLLFLIQNSFFFGQAKSPYSKFGLGILNFNFDGRTAGMAATSASISDGLSINLVNPAAWSSLKYFKVNAGVKFDYNYLSYETSNANYFQSDLNSFAFGFPIFKPYGLSFASGLIPYAFTSYEIRNKKNLEYTLAQKGKGSISKAFVGLSVKVPLFFNLGASYDYYLGNYSYISEVEFTDPEFIAASSTLERTYYGSGVSVGLLTQDFANLLNIENLNSLKFGVSLSSFIDIKADSLEKVSGNPGAIFDKVKKMKTEMPYRISAGVAFTYLKSYTIASDFVYQNWGLLKVNKISERNLSELARFSIGFEYNKDKKTLAFSDYIVYRAGASFATLPYNFNGNKINQYTLNFGLSYPIGFESYLDIAAEIGKNIAQKNLINETFFKVYFSINYSELWFIRAER